MLPQTVRDYLDAHRQEHLAGLCELLRIPTIANVRDEPDSCQRAAAWLRDRLRKLGLEAEIVPCHGDRPPDRPSVLATGRAAKPGAPTLLMYGHYDVQPADPLDLWTTPPFAPDVREGCVFARGAQDDKGQLFTHLMAVEAWQRAGGGLPVNVVALYEGEEEIGSPDMEAFIVRHRERLSADAALISDSDFFAEGLPSITYGLRGIVYFEIGLEGPSADIHSGLHGGAVTNPLNAVARIVAAMHDADGRVTIDGFYDNVQPLSSSERAEWAKLPFDEAGYAGSLGVGALGGGEKAYSTLERLWARPTLECNGLFGGYSGQGPKTVIPARAGAKVSMRLVPRQDPVKVLEAARRFVERHASPGVKVTFAGCASDPGAIMPQDSPAMRAARSAMELAFGRAPAMIRCGASVPVTGMIQRRLGVDPVMMGFGLPDDRVHSPNERFRLEQLWRGSVAVAAFLGNLAETT